MPNEPNDRSALMKESVDLFCEQGTALRCFFWIFNSPSNQELRTTRRFLENKQSLEEERRKEIIFV